MDAWWDIVRETNYTLPGSWHDLSSVEKWENLDNTLMEAHKKYWPKKYKVTRKHFDIRFNDVSQNLCSECNNKTTFMQRYKIAYSKETHQMCVYVKRENLVTFILENWMVCDQCKMCVLQINQMKTKKSFVSKLLLLLRERI